MMLLTAVLVLGTACSTETAPEAPVNPDARRAELITLGSAIGALQHCEQAKVYVPKVSIFADSFYRLATIMRPMAQLPDGHQDKGVAMIAHFEYQESLKTGIFTRYFLNKENKIETSDTKMDGDKACQMVEKIVVDARKPGKTLDVPAAEPINRPPQNKKNERDA